MKLDGLSDRFSRTSLTEVFGGLGLAEVHGPKLPKPDLGKISGQMSTCLQNQFTSIKSGMKTGPESRHHHAKMRGPRRRGWCGCLTGPDDPPEITYCVADNGGGGLTIQASVTTNTIETQRPFYDRKALIDLDKYTKMSGP